MNRKIFYRAALVVLLSGIGLFDAIDHADTALLVLSIVAFCGGTVAAGYAVLNP